MKLRKGFTRREILRLGSTLPLLAVGFAPGCGDDDGEPLPEYEFSGMQGPPDLFQHGVASGDPLSDAVILWTRLTIDGVDQVEVFWEMATDADFRNRVAADWSATDRDRDHTVKLDVFGPIVVGGAVLNPDQWDGYSAARQRFLDALDGIDDVVIISGDLHSSGAAELPRDPFDPESYSPETGDGSLAVEFVTPGVTSPALSPGSNLSFLPMVLAENRHIRFADTESRGYMIIDADRERAQATWYHWTQAAVETPGAEATRGPTFATYFGTRRLTEEESPAAPRHDPPPLATG